MEFAILMIFLIVAYYSKEYVFDPLSNWMRYQSLLPEHRRDKDKKFEAGQIWADDWRSFTIRAVDGDYLKIRFYALPDPEYPSFGQLTVNYL